MRKLKVECQLSIGYVTGNRIDTLEVQVDDDATPQEIEDQIQEAVDEWANNYINLSWEIL